MQFFAASFPGPKRQIQSRAYRHHFCEMSMRVVFAIFQRSVVGGAVSVELAPPPWFPTRLRAKEGLPQVKQPLHVAPGV
jgi:hypothetical protein